MNKVDCNNMDKHHVCKLDKCTCGYTQGKCEDMVCKDYIEPMKEFLVVFGGYDKETSKIVAYHSVIVKAENELKVNLKLSDYNCDTEDTFEWEIEFTRNLSSIKVIE